MDKKNYGEDFIESVKFYAHECPKCKEAFGFWTEECPDCNVSFIPIIEDEYLKFKTKNTPPQEFEKYAEIKELREKIFNAMDEKKPNKANELIVQYINEKEQIYSIRDDDKSEMWIYCHERKNHGIYLPNAKTYIKQYCRDILQSGFTPQKCNTIISKIETDTFIEQKDFFKIKDIYEIPVMNGLLNIRTNELLPFTYKKVYFNKLPIVYDESKKCDNILKHFNEVIKSKKDIKVIQEIFGWLLLKDYRPEKAIMFTGSGRNGKGKTIELMKRFLGPENCVNLGLKSLEGDDNFNISELHNKMANLGSDISNETLKETNKFKELTGHDMVSASRKFKLKVHFQNFAKMIYSANELPKTLDRTLAFFNRWIIIDFPFTFLPKDEYDKLEDKTNIKLRDDRIIEKLTNDDEMSGLLNWALEGYKKIEKNGTFSDCDSTDEIKNKWLRKSDSFTAFMMDIMETDYDSFVSKQDLKIAYTEYIKRHKLKPVTDKYIKNVITTEFGCYEIKPTIGEDRINCWEGIKFKASTGLHEKLENLNRLSIHEEINMIK